MMVGTLVASRYRLVAEIGRGGGGIVYRALETGTHRELALKLFPPDLSDFALEERFRREARVAAGMAHPHIISAIDSGTHEDSPFFVMPYIDGSDLGCLIRARSLDVADAVEIAAQIAEALAYSHTLGVVHRDVKPENVMVARRSDGRPHAYLMDFGLARYSFLSQRLTRKGAIVGTVAYFSPEQVLEVEPDGRADVYSLGVVLYEALTLEKPFTGAVLQVLRRIISERPRPVRELAPSVSEELERIVMSCLEKDPFKRPQTAAEFAAALRDLRHPPRPE